ncbi:hypothetical protein PSPO01_16623 [Paraphaeosphaeria sporulosa]
MTDNTDGDATLTSNSTAYALRACCLNGHTTAAPTLSSILLPSVCLLMILLLCIFLVLSVWGCFSVLGLAAIGGGRLGADGPKRHVPARALPTGRSFISRNETSERTPLSLKTWLRSEAQTPLRGLNTDYMSRNIGKFLWVASVHGLGKHDNEDVRERRYGMSSLYPDY